MNCQTDVVKVVRKQMVAQNVLDAIGLSDEELGQPVLLEQYLFTGGTQFLRVF
jgi:hypothetical protein